MGKAGKGLLVLGVLSAVGAVGLKVYNKLSEKKDIELVNNVNEDEVSECLKNTYTVEDELIVDHNKSDEKGNDEDE